MVAIKHPFSTTLIFLGPKKGFLCCRYISKGNQRMGCRGKSHRHSIVGSEISDPWANLGKSISLQILIEGLTARCFQQNSTIGSLGKSWNNGKTGF